MPFYEYGCNEDLVMVEEFSYEGRMVPDPKTLRSRLESGEVDLYWVLRAAVALPPLSGSIQKSVMEWLEDPSLAHLPLALFFIEGLALRAPLKRLADLLELDVSCLSAPMPQLVESPTHRLSMSPSPGLRRAGSFDGYSVAQVMTDVSLNLAVRGQGVRHRILMLALSEPELCAFSWKHLEAEHLGPGIPFMCTLLKAHPNLTGEVATRYSILAPEHVINLIQTFDGLDQDVLTHFASAAKKNLLRTGKVKIWAQCQRALRALRHE